MFKWISNKQQGGRGKRGKRERNAQRRLSSCQLIGLPQSMRLNMIRRSKLIQSIVICSDVGIPSVGEWRRPRRGAEPRPADGATATAPQRRWRWRQFRCFVSARHFFTSTDSAVRMHVVCFTRMQIITHPLPFLLLLLLLLLFLLYGNKTAFRKWYKMPWILNSLVWSVSIQQLHQILTILFTANFNQLNQHKMPWNLNLLVLSVSIQQLHQILTVLFTVNFHQLNQFLLNIIHSPLTIEIQMVDST